MPGWSVSITFSQSPLTIVIIQYFWSILAPFEDYIHKKRKKIDFIINTPSIRLICQSASSELFFFVLFSACKSALVISVLLAETLCWSASDDDDDDVLHPQLPWGWMEVITRLIQGNRFFKRIRARGRGGSYAIDNNTPTCRWWCPGEWGEGGGVWIWN